MLSFPTIAGSRGDYMPEERVDRRLAAIWAGDIAAQGGDSAKACFENRSGQFEKCSVLTRTAEGVAEGYCLSPVQQPRSMHPPTQGMVRGLF